MMWSKFSYDTVLLSQQPVFQKQLYYVQETDSFKLPYFLAYNICPPPLQTTPPKNHTLFFGRQNVEKKKSRVLTDFVLSALGNIE